MKIIIDIPNVSSLPDGITKEEWLRVIRRGLKCIMHEWPSNCQTERKVWISLGVASISLQGSSSSAPSIPSIPWEVTEQAKATASWLLAYLYEKGMPPKRCTSTVDRGLLLHFAGMNKPYALFRVHPDGTLAAGTGGAIDDAWDVDVRIEEEVADSVVKLMEFIEGCEC